MGANTLAEAVVEIKTQGLEQVKSGFAGVKSMLGQLGITPAALGFTALGGALAFATKRAIDAEKHLAEMKGALSSSGQAVNENIARFNQLAEAIQGTTTASKGEVNALILQGLHMGLSAQQAAQFASMSLGAAKATGKSAEEILDGAVKLANGMRSGLEHSVPAIANAATQSGKLAALSALGRQGMGMMQEEAGTTGGKMEHLSQSIGSLYTKLGSVFLPVVSSIVDGVQSFIDVVTQAIGAIQRFNASNATSMSESSASFIDFGNIGKMVFTWITEGVEWCAKSWLKMKLSLELVGAVLAATFDYGLEYVKVFATNSWNTITWFFENFGDIAKTVGNYVVTVFTNMGSNMKKLWQGVMDFLHGKGFHVDFTPLTEGFKNEIKKMPEYVKAQDLGYGQVINGILDKMNAIDEKFPQHWANAAKKATPELKKQLQEAMKVDLKPVAPKKTEGSGSSSSSLTDIWKNAQQSLLGGNVAKQQLNIAQQQLVVAKQQLAITKQHQHKGGVVIK
jgi:hypothetical protein